MKWEDVKVPVKQGGLGWRSLAEMNVAQQGKWMWRFVKDEDRLWKSVIEARWRKFDDGGVRRCEVRLHGLRLWRKTLMDRPKL